MEQFEKAYAKLISDTLEYGKVSQSRNAVTKSTFGKTLEIQLSKFYFPVIFGRTMHPKGVLGEFAAFLQGPKTVADFTSRGCNYWGLWANDGKLNVDYGNAWIDYNGVNQLQNVISSISGDPHSRRHLIDAWRPDRVAKGELSLPCCHYAYQFYVTANNKLDMIWIQRSVDLMIGLPSDIILAAAFNIMIASLTGLQPGKVIMQLGDCHIYEQHVFGAMEYIDRMHSVVPILSQYPKYKLHTEDLATGYNGFTKDTISLGAQQSMPPINFKLIS